MIAIQNKLNSIWFMAKVLVIFLFIAIPAGYFIYVKNLSMNEGREVKKLEREIVILKKINSNLENKLSEKINYKDIELKAKKQFGLNYVHENNNRIIMVKE